MSDASYSANKVDSNDENESKRINTTRTINKSAASTSVAPPQRKCIIRRCRKYRCRNRMCTRHSNEYSGNPPLHFIEGDHGNDGDDDDDDDSDDSPQRTTETLALAPHRYKLCTLKTCRSKIHEDVVDSMHGMCWKHYSQYRGRDIPIKLMREWHRYVMMKRLGRESEKSIKTTECLGKCPSCHTLLLEGRKGIPAALARQIVQNIKDKDLPAIESIHDAVLLEAQRVLGLHDDANGICLANHLQPGRYYLCNYATDWDKRGHGGDGQGNVFKHMSVDMIDDFFEWATSHTRKHQATHLIAHAARAGAVEQDEAMYSGLLHVPKAPPPPSQIDFLQHRLEKELVEQFQVLHPHADPENNWKRAGELLGCVDSSALLAIGIAIEEVMTASLLPWAKAHVEHCHRLERLHNLQSSDGLEQEEKESTTQSCVNPFVVWTLPISEAILELA
ncbi:hypothetical protein ACHAW6_005452 [Cyclotella cf. meneghiniana]